MTVWRYQSACENVNRSTMHHDRMALPVSMWEREQVHYAPWPYDVTSQHVRTLTGPLCTMTVWRYQSLCENVNRSTMHHDRMALPVSMWEREHVHYAPWPYGVTSQHVRTWTGPLCTITVWRYQSACENVNRSTMHHDRMALPVSMWEREQVHFAPSPYGVTSQHVRTWTGPLCTITVWRYQSACENVNRSTMHHDRMTLPVSLWER